MSLDIQQLEGVQQKSKQWETKDLGTEVKKLEKKLKKKKWIRTLKNCVAAEVNLPEDRLCLKMAYSILILLLEPLVYT